MSNGVEMSPLDEKDKQALQDIEDITSNADEIQRRVLTEILSTNAGVEYLQQHGLNGSTDVSTFKKLIPIVSYEQVKPYIDRIANGNDSPILCANPITKFLISTGTTGGEQKLFPIFEEDLTRRLSILNYLMPMMKQIFPGLGEGKLMSFDFTRPEIMTKGGTIATNVSNCIVKKSRSNMEDGSYTCPRDIILCTDLYQSKYCQLLCGLCQNEKVVEVASLFVSTLIHVFKFLENHWVLLANDIRTGTINSRITDPLVKESVMDILKPNPQLADFVEFECSQGWEGIITRLWPKTKYIKTIVTGSMSQYIPMLNHYSNGLPIFSHSYGSSESFFGLNLNPLCKPDEISYTFIPTLAYFEFLPVDRANDNGEVCQELVDLVDVELGQEYEVVVTTYAGLYRYCMGDILRVTGFKNKVPELSFVCRRNVVLSLDYDKTNEVDLHNAVRKASGHLRPFEATIVDYTSYADSSSIPGHYVLYWEIKFKEEEKEISIIPSSVYEDCCLVVEESLNSLYRLARTHEKIIGPLEIKIVEEGTFDKLRNLALNQGASMNQYKTPRCVKSAQIVKLLNSKVVSNHFSQKYPKWDPSYHRLFSNLGGD